MPTPTYDLVASNVVTNAVSSFTWSSISSTYRDLILVIQINGSNNDTYPRLRFNGSNTNVYSYVEILADGTNVTNNNGGSENGFQLAGAFAGIGSPALYNVQIFDANQSNKHKTALVRSGRAANRAGYLYGRWANTNAINSIEIYSSNGAFFTGIFYLYGIVS